MEKKSHETALTLATSFDDFEVIEYDALESITGGCGQMNLAGCSLNFICESNATAEAGTL